MRINVLGTMNTLKCMIGIKAGAKNPITIIAGKKDTTIKMCGEAFRAGSRRKELAGEAKKRKPAAKEDAVLKKKDVANIKNAANAAA